MALRASLEHIPKASGLGFSSSVYDRNTLLYISMVKINCSVFIGVQHC